MVILILDLNLAKVQLKTSSDYFCKYPFLVTFTHIRPEPRSGSKYLAIRYAHDPLQQMEQNFSLRYVFKIRRESLKEWDIIYVCSLGVIAKKSVNSANFDPSCKIQISPRSL